MKITIINTIAFHIFSTKHTCSFGYTDDAFIVWPHGIKSSSLWDTVSHLEEFSTPISSSSSSRSSVKNTLVHKVISVTEGDKQ